MVKARTKQNGKPVIITNEMRRVEKLIENVTSMREGFFKKFFDPRRDINAECGYPETGSITDREYRELYDRESIATRVVDILPDESWMTQPSVFETEDPEEETAFEIAWKEVAARLRGTSWHLQEEGNPVWEYLQRGDKQSGIGSFGVLLIGIDDGKKLHEPVDGIDETGKGEGSATADRKLIFLRAFDESLVNVSAFVVDEKNPRFDQPQTYQLTFNDPSDQQQSGIGLSTGTKDVHWSRVIHVADNLGSSEVFGVPRMRPVINRLLDLRKLYCGSAEMYWRGAFPGLSIESLPQLGTDVEFDVEANRTQMEKYMNGLQRYLSFVGFSAKSLAPQVVDPTPQIDVQIQAICVQLNIPKRIFTGSERGELASSQDDSSWNDTLAARQNGYITPRIIAPFIDRLIAMRVLPTPESYSIVWPDLNSLTEDEKASIAVKRTEAMAKFVQGDGQAIMALMDFYTKIMGMTDEEAEAVIEAVTAVPEGEEFTMGDDEEEFDEGQSFKKEQEDETS